MPITIWGDNLYTSVKEEQTYLLTNLALSYYNESRLSTTQATKISESSPAKLDWSQTVLSTNIRVCCPEIIAAKTNNYIFCRSLDCRKKITVSDTNTKTVACNTCQRIMLLARCEMTYNTELTIEHKGKQLKLTAFPDAMNHFKGYSNEDILESKVDITYDKKKIIVKIESHVHDLA